MAAYARAKRFHEIYCGSDNISMRRLLSKKSECAIAGAAWCLPSALWLRRCNQRSGIGQEAVALSSAKSGEPHEQNAKSVKPCGAIVLAVWKLYFSLLSTLEALERRSLFIGGAALSLCVLMAKKFISRCNKISEAHQCKPSAI